MIPEKHALIVDGFLRENDIRTNYNKKGSDEDMKMRVTMVPDETLKALLQFIEKNKLADTDYLFQNEQGTPFNSRYLERVFSNILIQAGIDSTGRKLCPHSLRFTYVTRMRRTIDAETVKKLAGHSSIEMTEYYTRASIPEMVESIKDVLPAVNKLFVQ